MKRKIVIITLSLIIAILILLFLFTVLFIEPWVKNKLTLAVNPQNSKYKVEIGNVHISLLTSVFKLKGITIRLKPESKIDGGLDIEIPSIECKGVDFYKAIFNNEYEIDNVIIQGLNAVIPITQDSLNAIIPNLKISIGKITVYGINLEVKGISNTKVFKLKEGNFNFYELQMLEKDTLNLNILRQFDFKVKEVFLVSDDSMYSNTIKNIDYSSTSKKLTIDTVYFHPNYNDYDYTSRFKFQSDCIEARVRNISIQDFSIIDYIKSKNLLISYIEIGDLNIKAFRDRRKPFLHSPKPIFQEIMYNYPGKLSIDSIGLINGNVIYTEHAIKANYPGKISFSKINAKIYNVTNDTIFKTQKAFFEVKSTALLMGKGKVNISLKSQLYDKYNTFSMQGILSSMDAKEMNPMLERNAFMFVTSGTIDEMKFSFTANNYKAKGNMTFRYHGLDLAIKNSMTDDTTAIKEVLVSVIANLKVMNSNPLPRKEVRVGIIDFNRNPETFLFNYCAKALLSGIKSSISRKPSKKRKPSKHK